MEDPKPLKLVPRYCSYCGEQMVEEQMPPWWYRMPGRMQAKRLPPRILWVCPKYFVSKHAYHDHIVRARPLPPSRS